MATSEQRELAKGLTASQVQSFWGAILPFVKAAEEPKLPDFDLPADPGGPADIQRQHTEKMLPKVRALWNDGKPTESWQDKDTPQLSNKPISTLVPPPRAEKPLTELPDGFLAGVPQDTKAYAPLKPESRAGGLFHKYLRKPIEQAGEGFTQLVAPVPSLIGMNIADLPPISAPLDVGEGLGPVADHLQDTGKLDLSRFNWAPAAHTTEKNVNPYFRFTQKMLEANQLAEEELTKQLGVKVKDNLPISHTGAREAVRDLSLRNPQIAAPLTAAKEENASRARDFATARPFGGLGEYLQYQRGERRDIPEGFAGSFNNAPRESMLDENAGVENLMDFLTVAGTVAGAGGAPKGPIVPRPPGVIPQVAGKLDLPPGFKLSPRVGVGGRNTAMWTVASPEAMQTSRQQNLGELYRQMAAAKQELTEAQLAKAVGGTSVTDADALYARVEQIRRDIEKFEAQIAKAEAAIASSPGVPQVDVQVTSARAAMQAQLDTLQQQRFKLLLERGMAQSNLRTGEVVKLDEAILKLDDQLDKLRRTPVAEPLVPQGVPAPTVVLEDTLTKPVTSTVATDSLEKLKQLQRAKALAEVELMAAQQRMLDPMPTPNPAAMAREVAEQKARVIRQTKQIEIFDRALAEEKRRASVLGYDPERIGIVSQPTGAAPVKSAPSNQIVGPSKPTVPSQVAPPPAVAAPTPPVAGSAVSTMVQGAPQPAPKLLTQQMIADQNLVPLVPAPTTTAGPPRGVGTAFETNATHPWAPQVANAAASPPVTVGQVANAVPSPTAAAGQAAKQITWAEWAKRHLKQPLGENIPVSVLERVSPFTYVPGWLGRNMRRVLDYTNPFAVPFNVASGVDLGLRRLLRSGRVNAAGEPIPARAGGLALKALYGTSTAGILHGIADTIDRPAGGSETAAAIYDRTPAARDAQQRLLAPVDHLGLAGGPEIYSDDSRIMAGAGLASFTKRGPSDVVRERYNPETKEIEYIRPNEGGADWDPFVNAGNIAKQYGRNIAKYPAVVVDKIYQLVNTPNARISIDTKPLMQRRLPSSETHKYLASMEEAVKAYNYAKTEDEQTAILNRIKATPVTDVAVNSGAYANVGGAARAAQGRLHDVSALLTAYTKETDDVRRQEIVSVLQDELKTLDKTPISNNMLTNYAQSLAGVNLLPDQRKEVTVLLTDAIKQRPTLGEWLTPGVLGHIQHGTPQSPDLTRQLGPVGFQLKGQAGLGPVLPQKSTGASQMPPSDSPPPVQQLVPTPKVEQPVTGAAPPTADNSSAVYNSPEAQAARQTVSKLISQGVKGVRRLFSPSAPSTESLPVLPELDGGLQLAPIKPPAGAPATIPPAATTPAATTPATTTPATTTPATTPPAVTGAPPTSSISGREPGDDMRLVNPNLSSPPPPAPVTLNEANEKLLTDNLSKLKYLPENEKERLLNGPLATLFKEKDPRNITREELLQATATNGLSPETVIQDLAAQLKLPPELAKSYWGSLSSDSQTLLMMGVGMSTLSLLWSMFGGGGGGKGDEDEEGGSSFLKQALMFLGLAAAGWGGLGGTFSKMPQFDRVSRGKEMWEGIQNDFGWTAPTSKSPSSQK